MCDSVSLNKLWYSDMYKIRRCTIYIQQATQEIRVTKGCNIKPKQIQSLPTGVLETGEKKCTPMGLAVEDEKHFILQMTKWKIQKMRATFVIR